MSTFAESTRPSRDEALKIASERKAARRQRTLRIRKAVAVLAVSAFLGPFAVIYSNVASGKDPALATTTTTVARASTGTTSGTNTAGASTTTSGSSGSTSGSTSSGSTGSGSTSSGSNATSSPAPVTTQQS